MIGRYGISVLFFLLFMVPSVWGELRQWTDGNGVKHFSNKEELPAGTQVEKTFEEKEGHPEEPKKYQRSHPAFRPQPEPRQTAPARKKRTRDDIRAEISSSEAKVREVFERIYTKRRYAKRRGKQNIEMIQRLNGEIEALEKSGVDTAKRKMLEEERAAARKRLFNANLRTRKGVGDDIQEYKRLIEKITELKQSL
jgi:hypothetical protein